MPTKNNTFPWGIYIGDLIDNNDTIPLCLDSKQGGFCVLFDEESEAVANNFIENVALKLFEVLPIGDIGVNIFDFGKKRFMYLSALQKVKLCDIAYSPNTSTVRFNEIEEMALYRLQELLSFDAPTLCEYNQQSDEPEQYRLLLLNLEDFPDDISSPKRIKKFIESAYEAGFYTIAFGKSEILYNQSKATDAILNHFPRLDIVNQEFKLTKELFEFVDMIEGFEFEYLNDNKDKIVKSLLNQLEQEDKKSIEQDFLSIPIGKRVDGRDDVYFALGDKSENYHAFITGQTGTGKTTLLNNIIMGIAKQYTSDEIRLYLMDYKNGTEFQVFRHHPNCEKIFLDNEDTEASIGMLEEFEEVIRERSRLFRQYGVKDIDQYNKIDSIKPLYRAILIIDEVQQLFKGNYKQVNRFTELLKNVTKQGRSFGLHIILSTQTLYGSDVDKTLMSQITLRISYKLANYNDADKIFNYKNSDAVLKLKRYELIYNTQSGDREANVICRANAPVDIEKGIDNIIASRDKGLILKPLIVQSLRERKKEVSMPKQYSDDSEKKLLDKIKNSYKIKPNKEFIDG